MNEKDILISRFLDNKKRANDNFMLTHTSFLSLDERNIVSVCEREYNSEIGTFFYGGFDDAERTVAIFIPKCFGITDIEEYFFQNPDEAPFDLLKITKDRFSVLSHRDYLGALMGLGIKRETIGDIVITDECAFVFALKSISNYICENFSKAGRGSLQCEICSLRAFFHGEEKSETVFSSVASLRLDSVVSSAFNLSRNNSAEAIKSGTVYVNSLQILKTDYILTEKDKIVLRGRGKVVIDEILGENKKGRIHINIKKFR